MNADLDTLLRDAGRGPTVDVDVDAVHTRGRWRALVRRTATGLGVVAVAGAVVIGAAQLAPEPVPFIDDAVPSEDAPPSEEVPEEPGPRSDQFTPDVAMADLGVTVVDVVRSEDGAGGLHVRVVTNDGVVEEFSTLAGAMPPAGSVVVVDHDLRVWANDVDPNLLRGHADDPLGSAVARTEDGVGWGLLGSVDDGRPLVTRAIGTDGQFTDDVGEVLVWAEEGPEPIPGITGRPTLTEATPVAAAAVAEHLAVLSVVGETSLVDLHLAGAAPVAIAETGGVGRWFTALTIVGDEVWVSERRQGATDLWIVPMDGSPVRRVPTPFGRTGEDREVVGLAGVEGPDGPVVAMSTRGEDGTARAYAVAVEAARAAGIEGEVAADALVPDGVFRLLDAEGQVHLLPAPEPEPDEPTSECATTDAERINSAPDERVVVWFECTEGHALLGEDEYWPFVPVERFAAAELAPDAAGLTEVLDAWAAGPNDQERAAGLAGGLDPEIATIGGVSVDGATVTIDVEPGPQVGVLSTSAGSATFTMAVVGAVLQFDAYQSVVLTLDGSCSAWGGHVQAGECLTYDRGAAPWNQGPG